MKVPGFMLKKLYVPKSLVNEGTGVSFRLKNTLATATLVAAPRIAIDGEPIPDKSLIFRANGQQMTASEITPATPIKFDKNTEVEVHAQGRTLKPGGHLVKIEADSKEWQTLAFEVEDTLAG